MKERLVRLFFYHHHNKYNLMNSDFIRLTDDRIVQDTKNDLITVLYSKACLL